MASRAMSGPALTRPELCTLMAHGKLWLSGRMDASELAADPALEAELIAYFPRQLREGYLDEIRRHRLRRELIGTAITNDLVNRLGPAALGRLIADTDADPVAVFRAAIIAREAFALTAICTQVEALDMKVPAAAQLTVLAALRRLHEATTRTLLASSDGAVGIAAAVAALKPGLAELAAKASARAAGSQEAMGLIAQGVPAELAALAAALPELLAAPSIVQLAAARGIPVETAADAWAGAGDAFGIERLRTALAAMPSGGAWGARAVAALSDDLASLQGALAASALRGGVTAAALLETSGHAGRRAVGLAREAAAMPDLAAVTVAMRALRALEPG
jgi:glutamate dehydrogenase